MLQLLDLHRRTKNYVGNLFARSAKQKKVVSCLHPVATLSRARSARACPAYVRSATQRFRDLWWLTSPKCVAVHVHTPHILITWADLGEGARGLDNFSIWPWVVIKRIKYIHNMHYLFIRKLYMTDLRALSTYVYCSCYYYC